MARRRLTVLLALLTFVLSSIPVAVSAAPATALKVVTAADPGSPKIEIAGIGVLEADSAPVDAYEAAGDDFPAPTVRDVTAHIPRWDSATPGWGMNPYTESHTIDTADTIDWDEDWLRFTVSDTDLSEWPQLSYRLDAFSSVTGLDLVIDVYRDGSMVAMANSLSGDDPLAAASNDDSAWCSGISYAENGRWSSVTFTPTVADTYYVRVRPYWSDVVDGFTGHAGAYTLRIKTGQVERIAGADRIDTAVRTSREGWPTNPANSQDTTVVIACSNNYPDALAASSLAGACGGPILLSYNATLPSAVKTEIQRIGARGAYVVGGTKVLQDAVVASLKTFLASNRVQRVAGNDRYATAVEVMKMTKRVVEGNGGTMPKAAFLVSGVNYPDALAVGPLAYADTIPVLLTTPQALQSGVGSAIAMYGVSDVIVAGGTAAVSTQVTSDLIDDGMSPNRILRVSGHDRYETAKEIAAWSCDLKGPGVRHDSRVGTLNNSAAFPALTDPARNVFASGESFPDALAGGPFAGKARSPILLTPKSIGTPYLFGADGELPAGSTAWYTDLATNSSLPIMESYLLGGAGAVSDDVWAEIDNNTGEAP